MEGLLVCTACPCPASLCPCTIPHCVTSARQIRCDPTGLLLIIVTETLNFGVTSFTLEQVEV